MNKTLSQETQELFDKLARLTGRPVGADTKPEPLGDLIDQLDDVHSELPALLREPELSDAEFDQLWNAHKHLSKALQIMVRVQRQGEQK